jgi:hypothetical protein
MFGDPSLPEWHDMTCTKDPKLESTSPISGDRFVRVNALVRNATFDCQLFEPLPPPAPKRPWWRFW